MGILQRLLAPWREQRETPRKNWGETDISSFGGGTFDSAAGVSVSTDSAQRIAAVYACGRFLANAIAVRPVTVYRLVLEGSVEEKILELHERKRGLAEGLLANADDADVRVDLETLERLLRE